jgi:predicted dehydrogenase
MDPVRTGVVGCGKISPAYVNNLKEHFSHLVDVRACADVDLERAKSRAEELKIPRACSVPELMADASIELVVDLTNPAAHHPVSMAALRAGKHVFVEKPLATTRALARELLETARARGVTLAGAADTFLGAGLSTCRRLLGEGAIGELGTARAFISLAAKNPFYQAVYGGALYDIAPYYLIALIVLLGPVVRVTGFVRTSEAMFEKGHPLAFPFTTPMTGAAALVHESGLVSTLHATVEASSYYPHVEIFGSDATLRINDANGYGGTIVKRDAKNTETELSLDPGFAAAGRGLGVAEQALAIRQGRAPRASGELSYHVLDVQTAVQDSSEKGAAVAITSGLRPLPFDFAELAKR